MASHQNAAKKLKALLRRVHFPVQRFKQLPPDNTSSTSSSSSVSSASSTSSGGGGNGINPWDGIVGGDPRAALIVLHWTLLDMSPLFATFLLDRDYGGLQSLPDFKFVTTCLNMLRDEFGCRPQLTAEQFLTAGYAEVKLRLLAEVVELVMSTHHSLADNNKASVNSNHGSPSTISGSNGGQGSAAVAQRRATAGTASGGGRSSTRGSSSGGNNGPPWGAPFPGPPHPPRSGFDDRGGAMMGNSSSSGSSHGCVQVVPHSPPAAHGPRHQHPSMPLDGAFLGGGSGGNVGRMGGGSGGLLISGGGGGGSGHHDRYHPQYISSSLTGFNDDLNAPPPLRLSRNGPGSCPGPSAHSSSSTYATVPRARSSWNAGDPRQHEHKNTVTGGDWVRGPGSWGCGENAHSMGRLLPGSLPSMTGAPGDPHSGPSLPLGPLHTLSQQSHLQQLQQQLVVDEGSATAAAEPVSSGGGGGCGGQQSDWAAVQKAFGAPSSLHLPLPPPTMVPSSPHSGSTAPKLLSLPSSSSSLTLVTSASTPLETSMAGYMSKHDGFGYGIGVGGGGGCDTGTEGTAVDSDISGEGGSEHSSSSVGGGSRGGAGSFGGGMDGAGDDAVLSSLSAAMTRTQVQIEAMLERQSRALDERMGGIETMLSTRLSLLEGKIHGLENHRAS